MFSSLSNTRTFTGNPHLKNAERFIAAREKDGERWEVVENQTQRTVVMRRRHWEKH